MKPAYRYVSTMETNVIRKQTPMRVPNIDTAGRPKTVYMTWDHYTLASQAEQALRIGSLNPYGATPPPADGLELDLTGVNYTYNGIVPGGTGTELTTTGAPLVTSIFGLGP